MAIIPINKLAEVLGAEVEETVRAVKIELFSEVVTNTRVDTGRLRSNWQTTTGSPASGTLERTDEGSALSEISSTVKPDTLDMITNNLPYAEIIEEKDGNVPRAVARLQRIINEQTRGR